MGERDDYNTVDVSNIKIPVITFGDNYNAYVYHSSIAGYLGLPMSGEEEVANAAKTISAPISKLPFNAYALVWNNFFRDQNLQQAKKPNLTDASIAHIGQENPNAIWETSAPQYYTGKLAKVNKNLDYFNNVFTSSQKGSEVTIGLSGTVPVTTYPGDIATPMNDGIKFKITTTGANPTVVPEILRLDVDALRAENTGNANAPTLSNRMYPSNLQVNLEEATSISINDLREAIAMQKINELELVGGTKYYEQLESFFGVDASEAELNYPQYIGGSQMQLIISQVVQTSTAINDTTSQPGTIFGYSVNAGNVGGVSYRATEHGILMSFIIIKQKHTYQQGIARYWTKSTKYDFFNPALIGLGFQPIYSYEIYGIQTTAEVGNVFAYAPAWEHYRVDINKITGMLNARSVITNGSPTPWTSNTLAIWHFGDVYDTAPVLSPSFKLETPQFLDNTLIIPSETVDNFIADISHSGSKIRLVDPLGVPKIT